MKRSPSLRGRLIMASAAWIGAALLIVGTVLVLSFRAHLEARLDQALADQLDELIAATNTKTTNTITLDWRPFDPRFGRPQSGSYWQVSLGSDVQLRSTSLLRETIPLPPALSGTQPGAASRHDGIGPGSEPLRLIVQTISLPRLAAPATYLVAAPAVSTERDVRTFTNQIVVTLSLLAAGLLLAVFLQVRFGLNPLAQLRQRIAGIRAGDIDEIRDPFPTEVEPVVDELNALLRDNAKSLDRARTGAADLAHALKNPISVINNEMNEVEPEVAAIVHNEITSMRAAIERHLSRSRRAGGYRGRQGRCEVAPVVTDLQFSLERLYAGRELQVQVQCDPSAVFRGDREDLEEILGNLLDNAFKWASRQVRLTVTTTGQELILAIEDDGPGIPPAQISEALDRGKRLDESTPGSGIGLAIVADAIESYDGQLALETAGLGGLLATVRLPARPGDEPSIA